MRSTCEALHRSAVPGRKHLPDHRLHPQGCILKIKVARLERNECGKREWGIWKGHTTTKLSYTYVDLGWVYVEIVT